MVSATTARVIALTLLFLIILVSAETFNTAFTGLSDADVVRQTADLRPQIASLGLWSLIIVLSFLPGAVRFPARPMQMGLPVLLVLWSALSFAWSDNPAATVPKGIGLIVTNYAAWRLAAMITISDMFACVYAGAGALLVASAALALFVPSVGVVQREWQHIGDWQGVFASKQGLGMISGVLTGIVLLRVASRPSWIDCFMAVVGAACLVGSGSRGAGAMEVAAVIGVLVIRTNHRLTGIVTAMFWVVLLLAIANIAYFAVTGSQTIDVFGAHLDITERTFIWQYSIGLWSEQPYIGYGLNGFWTQPGVYDGFYRLHGWVLDNFHSGYISVLVETGLVGFGTLLALCWKLTANLHRLLMQAGPAQRLSLEMAAVFLLMFLTINLTETYLSRSTNFLAMLFAFLVAKIVPVSSALPATDNASNRSLVRA